MSIDFEQPAYLTTNLRTVNASLRLIKKYPGSSVQIGDRDVELKMKLSNLLVAETESIKPVDQSDSRKRKHKQIPGSKRGRSQTEA